MRLFTQLTAWAEVTSTLVSTPNWRTKSFRWDWKAIKTHTGKFNKLSSQIYPHKNSFFFKPPAMHWERQKIILILKIYFKLPLNVIFVPSMLIPPLHPCKFLHASMQILLCVHANFPCIYANSPLNQFKYWTEFAWTRDRFCMEAILLVFVATFKDKRKIVFMDCFLCGWCLKIF